MKKIIVPLLFLICSCSQAQPSSLSTQMEIAPVSFAELPAQISFAGEAIPLEYGDVRESLNREMLAVLYMHSTTLQTLSRTTRYFPVIEPILKEYGIPEDFKYLAMTESSLNPNAASGAGARGMWQFMTSAAKDFGLETGENVDMRYNVEESTRAACKYLKRAYQKYGSWIMAAASYNMGMAGLSSRIHKQGVNSYFDLSLPEETMRYVFHIISYKILVADPAKYGYRMRDENYYKPYTNIKYIEVNHANIDWTKVALNNGTNYKILRILNPWIRSYSYANSAGKSYKVAVPTGNFRTLGY